MAWNSFFNSHGFHVFLLATSIISEAAIPHITECGDLSIEQPAILGRNVTFTFTPSVHRYDKSATLLWQRTNKQNSWSTLRGSNFDQFEADGTYYFIVINTVSTETKDDAIFYRIQYFNDTVNCAMETPKLELKAIPHISECGDLSIEQPAILGRNVTFTFTPSVHRYDKSATLLWQRKNKKNPWSSLRGSNFEQHEVDGTYYFIVINTVSTETKDDAVFYRIQYFNDTINCTMETPKLELKDLLREPCGLVYLKTAKIEYGEDMELEYYPKKDVIDNPGSYLREWVRSYSKRTTNLRLTNGVYEKTKMSNDTYVLTISSFNSTMNGEYGVRCHGSSEYYSNMVPVILPVAPDAPIFNGSKDIGDCENCIVGEADEQFRVFCKTSGGTEPVTVTMAIGNTNKTANHDYVNGGYWAFFYLLNRHHMTSIKCSVKNDVISSPLTVTARLYVIKPPVYQRLETPSVLEERDPVNITCEFAAGRPTPTLSLKISGAALSPVQQTDTFNTTDQSYSSVISLTSFERNWNDRNISCCRSSEWYKTQDECFTPRRVKYLFPPTDVKLEIETKGNPTRVYAVCTIFGSNPVCKAKWQAPRGSIYSERSSKNTSKSFGAWDSEYRVIVNTSHDHPGDKITCSADCSTFTVSMQRSVLLPYAPVIEFNTSNSVLDIYKGSKVHVKCTARSSPQANISWIEHTTSGEVSRKLMQCQLATDCVITVEGDNITQKNLVCNTKHLLGSDSKNLIINIIEKKPESAEDQQGTTGADKSLYWVLLGAVVCVVAIIITAFLIVRKKRNYTKAASNRTDDDAVTFNDKRGELNPGKLDNIGQAGAQAAASNAASGDDATYSQVDKSRSKQVAANTSKTNYPKEGGQLVYVDLDFEPSGYKPQQGAVVNRRDSPTEYVGIDFMKTAERQMQGNESNEMDNIYANQ